MKKNSTYKILTLLLLFAITFINAQDIRVIDNKGTLRHINKVTYGTNAPTSANPSEKLKGDIYIVGNATTPEETYLFDGANWVNISSNNNWSLTGNTGTNPSTNYLGTTGPEDLVIKTNTNIASSTERIRIGQGRFENQAEILINTATNNLNRFYPLVVKANGQEVLSFQDSGANKFWNWDFISNTGNLSLTSKINTNPQELLMLFKPSGYVGIGVEPTNGLRLDVNGKVKIRDIQQSNSIPIDSKILFVANDIGNPFNDGVIRKMPSNLMVSSLTQTVTSGNEIAEHTAGGTTTSILETVTNATDTNTASDVKVIATYTNENGTSQNIEETVTNATDTNTASDVKVIATYTNENGTNQNIEETVTNATDTNTASDVKVIATYTNENGTSQNIEETVTNATDTNTASDVKVIATYTNENGTSQNIEETVTNTTDTNTASDVKVIATYTNENGTSQNIEETVTKIEQIKPDASATVPSQATDSNELGFIKYKDEDDATTNTVARVVSTDTGNSLKIGSDGGAYYVGPRIAAAGRVSPDGICNCFNSSVAKVGSSDSNEGKYIITYNDSLTNIVIQLTKLDNNTASYSEDTNVISYQNLNLTSKQFQVNYENTAGNNNDGEFMFTIITW